MAEEARYNNRMLDDRFDRQTRDLKEHMELLISPVLAQVTKTNGRVTQNEKDIVGYKVWRGWMTGGMAMLMVFVPVIIGFMTFIGLRVINFDRLIKTAVDEALHTNQ